MFISQFSMLRNVVGIAQEPLELLYFLAVLGVCNPWGEQVLRTENVLYVRSFQVEYH